VGERYSALASDSIVRGDNPRSLNAASADGSLGVLLRVGWVGKGGSIWAERGVNGRQTPETLVNQRSKGV